MRCILTLLIIGLLLHDTLAQSVSISYRDQPLNEVLLDLNTRYQVPISIDADVSTHCLISLSRQFPSVQEALQAIASQCQLELKLVNEVYSFQRSDKAADLAEQIAQGDSLFVFQGVVREKSTQEPVPFAALLLGNRYMISDADGLFSIKWPDNQVRVQVMNLGYATLDTTVQSGKLVDLLLMTESMQLEEVLVSDAPTGQGSHVGPYAGQLKMNDVSNHLIPGQNINAVFNNIRMFPGITASGESLSDYLICGSYAGQNLTLFDDITIFNSWGINDDIGRINPLMVKNVEVFKGGYDAEYGDRVGGVILIDGKQGDVYKPTLELNIGNQLAMGHLGIPAFAGSSVLQVAGRVSYFDFLDWSAAPSNIPNGAIVPKYQFQDFNLKWSTQFGNGDKLQVSALHSRDEYVGRLVEGKRRLEQDIQIGSSQTGISGKYIKSWNNRGYTSLTVSESTFDPEVQINYFSNEPGAQDLKSTIWLNTILERSVKLKHQWPLKTNVQFRAGAGFIENASKIKSSIFNVRPKGLLQRYYAFGGAFWQVRNDLFLKMSLRSDYAENELYWQPRISAIWDVTRRWNWKLSTGRYYQFISNKQIQDYLGNSSNFWQVTNLENEKPVAALHHVIGTHFQVNPHWELNASGYWITQGGATNLIIDQNNQLAATNRESRSIGIDLFAGVTVKSHRFTLAYALNQTLEHFKIESEDTYTPYREAPQSQRHELKGATIFNFGQVKLSLSSVYGSGFPQQPPIRREDFDKAQNGQVRQKKNPTVRYSYYWRTDAAMEYTFLSKKSQWALGASAINLFNRQNVRFNQSVFVPESGIINTLGTPFTFMMYLKVKI